jgi:hypothetical protein
MTEIDRLYPEHAARLRAQGVDPSNGHRLDCKEQR